MQSRNIISGLILKTTVCILALAVAPQVKGAAALEVTSSTSQARKGETFKLYLKISAQEDMNDLAVDIVPPIGFEPTLENASLPKSLERGSSYTASYAVVPPGTMSRPDRGGGTQEDKIFVFNVSYSTSAQGEATRKNTQSIHLTVDYSLSRIAYLLNGFIGLLLGAFIKITAKLSPDDRSSGESANASADGDNAAETAEIAARTPGRVRTGRLRKILRSESGGLLTTLAIGFVVLLVLSNDSIPAKGYYDSIALGVAVGILSDDQLLGRVKAIIPR